MIDHLLFLAFTSSGTQWSVLGIVYGGDDRDGVRTRIYIDMAGLMRKEESTVEGPIKGIE